MAPTTNKQKTKGLTMSTDLVPAEVANLPTKFTEKDADAAVKSGDYLSRLQLMTANSKKCKSGDFPTNHWALVNGSVLTDLGKSIDVVNVAWRPKALDTEEGVSCYDTETDLFAGIQERSNEKNSGCMCGLEFLVYVPSQEAWAEFYMGSKSSRRDSPSMKALVGKGVTLKSKEIVTKKYTWFNPDMQVCSLGLTLPDTPEVMEIATKFNNPPESSVEKVEEDTGRAR